MGMRIDTARTQKCLYGISNGMTTKELIDYTGYGARTVKKIAENPEEYQRKLEEAKKRKKMNGYRYGRKYSQMNGKK